MKSKMLLNKVGREIPSYIEGYKKITLYKGVFEGQIEGRRYAPLKTGSRPGDNKLLYNIKEAIKKSKLKDGMTISFHHHLRNGDYVLNMVMKEIAEMGIKNLTICASSITKAHGPLVDHIKNGVVTGLETSGLRGEIAREITENNILRKPVVFRSHGGRARAIEAGEVIIDIAFIAAPTCDPMGNLNGMEGKSAFGAIGYPIVDVKYAEKVVAITDNLVSFPLNNISISMSDVDYVVQVDEIGDPSKIATGSTRVTKNPLELLIAEKAANILIQSGMIKEGFSFQAGSGGASLAVCKFLRSYMEGNNITGSFAAGGTTAYLVDLMKDGLFKAILDIQTLDSAAVGSLLENQNHIEISASTYANPHNKSCSAHQLDIMVLSATEIDTNFNINSMTGSNGMIMGAIGGAQDTAAGAKLTVVVAPTMRKRIPIIVDKVTNIVTPGETIDILVTERGICINPKRIDLIEILKDKIDLISIGKLKNKIEHLTAKGNKPDYLDNIVGIIEYRDGTVIDIIKQVKI